MESSVKVQRWVPGTTTRLLLSCTHPAGSDADLAAGAGELRRQVLTVRELSLSGNTDKTSGTLGCHTDVDHMLPRWFLNLPDPKNHLENPTPDEPERLGKGPGICTLFL